MLFPSEVASALGRLGVRPNSLAGAVLDAGPSIHQLHQPHRGFRDTRLHPLDMRMNQRDGLVHMETNICSAFKGLAKACDATGLSAI